ncbi:uncharacterized protein LOC114332977 [Diabrotica virgifera virgifera]|uniref:THAP-type domain-containing protein n=1 Tax=Diabrotica virgifera virgifera TaxID=50390 RepID=A0ABM5IQ41_DIAVI|nr:uncharacterized protein LOC114332977 [Diabrotica virgifera virgifera]
MLCQREDLLNKTNLNLNRLCSVHFENTMFSNKTRNRLCKNAGPRLFPSIEDSPNQHSNVDQDGENSFDPVNEEDEEQREELATVPLGGEDDSEVVLQKNQQTQTF